MASDIRELNRRAVLTSAALVATITPADLDRPTPCADWNLGELVAHMSAQHRGFAAAADGGGDSLEEWAVDSSPADLVADHQAAVDQVIAAFAADGVLDRRFSLAEFSATATYPAATAIGFHFIDYVVHGWDVARALGVAFDPEPDIAAAALLMALEIPNGPERQKPGAAFAPGVDRDDDAPVIDRVVSLLGRSPTWPD
jgi:uncharacterized protein (TIGR03086 family)